jgi:dihydroorotase-like cyclic amidohydrolase
MEKIDLAITGGIVVNASGMRRGDIFISNGLVKKVGLFDEDIPSSRTIDASGMFILPGLIDSHVHPVYGDRIETLSKAAVLSGVTTLLSFIGAVKAWGLTGGLPEAIERYMEEADRTSVIDFGIHCSLMQDDIENAAEWIPKMVKMGVVSA